MNLTDALYQAKQGSIVGVDRANLSALAYAILNSSDQIVYTGDQLVSAINNAGGASSGSEAWVHLSATGGSGTSASPWTGWDTAITWTAFTRYCFKSGYYSFATSPNYLQPGIEIIGEPGTYLIHTGTGHGFVMDAGETPLWIQNVRVENIIVKGSPTLLTGTLSVSNGGTNVTGSGTTFTTQVTVGDSITFAYGQQTSRSYIVSEVTDNTNLVINRAASQAESSQAAKVTKTQNGFYLRGVRNSAFDRCSVKDVALAAIWTEACVTNSMRLFRTTFHEPEQGDWMDCRPQYGIVTTGRGAHWSTTWNIEEPIIEGTQIYGIWFKADSYGTTVINGTCEHGEGIGIQIDGTSNTIIGIDLEANDGDDLVVNGNANLLLSVFSIGTTTITADGDYTTVLGGKYATLTDEGSFRSTYINPYASVAFTPASDSIFIMRSNANFTSQIGVPMPRVRGITASGAMATDTTLGNLFTISTASDCTLSAPSNPTSGVEITYRFDNNSGETRSIAWNAIFASMTGATLPTTIDQGKTIYVTLRYSSFWTKWQCISVVAN